CSRVRNGKSQPRCQFTRGNRMSPSRSLLAARLVLAEGEHGVVTAEGETVAQGDVELVAAGDVGDVVEVACGVDCLVVDRGREDLIANGQDGDRCFDCSCGAEA